MPKARSKPYKGGDKLVIYLPFAISNKALKFINSPKFVSPIIVKVIEEKAAEVYPENNKNSGE